MSVSTQKNMPLCADERTATAGVFHIEDVYPCIDAGRFPVKRLAGDTVDVWADIFRSGHDVIVAQLIWRHEQERDWQRSVMSLQDNDRWFGIFAPAEPGHYVYAIEAWTDEFATWKRDFELKQKAGQDITLDALEGAALLTRAQYGGKDATAIILRQCEDFLHKGDPASLLVPELTSAMAEGCARSDLTRSRFYPLTIDRAPPSQARGTKWFHAARVPSPASTARSDDCIARLPDIAAMGFDVLYLTPIHPIGTTNRKGKNNALTGGAGRSWQPLRHRRARKAATMRFIRDSARFDDFRGCRGLRRAWHGDRARLRGAVFARSSLDQAASGMVQVAPGRHDPLRRKSAEEISGHRQSGFLLRRRGSLWNALRDVVLFWVKQGVRIFRVDNPHTKPFPFWEWLIREVQATIPMSSSSPRRSPGPR